MKYAIIASAFSGNKGAASMLEASIQTIKRQDPTAEFVLFSVYPKQDKIQNKYDYVSILPADPLTLGFFINPVALIYKVLPPFRPLLRKQRHIKALHEADVFMDQGGITFVDGRTKFLLYNLASILPPLFLGTRVVKCSQAMGPFKNKLNRMCARIVLPRIDVICARGEKTYEYLKELGLKNVILAADYAFLLSVGKEEAKSANNILKKIEFVPGKKIVGILPSQVVRAKSEKKGYDYINFNISFINNLLEKDYNVLLLPHSARSGSASLHNNDLPVCQEIARLVSHENFAYLDQEFSAQEIRHIIGTMDFIVTSRFHAMVSSLASTKPALIVGWSHKYGEVMDMFGLSNLAVDSSQLDLPSLSKAFDDMVAHEKQIVKSISSHLPDVKKSSHKQVDEILQ